MSIGGVIFIILIIFSIAFILNNDINDGGWPPLNW